MERKEHVTILMFGSLYRFRQDRGLAPTLELPLPPEGRRALDIAGDLGLPLDSIGAIYCNHRPAGLQQLLERYEAEGIADLLAARQLAVLVPARRVLIE